MQSIVPMQPAPIARLALCFGILAIAGCGDQPRAPELPRLAIDADRIAVAGISSGAIMAQQTHLAYAERLRGALLLAGPPYQCARGSLDVALNRCMKDSEAPLDVPAYAATITARAASGELAPLSGLEGDRVIAVHGKQDGVVPASVARASLAIYEQLPVAGSMSLTWDGEGDFAHVWPTLADGGDCAKTAPPYIGRCERDLAGDAMRELFGAPRRDAAPQATASLATFGQAAHATEGADAFLGDIGYLYRPAQCTDAQACGLLVVFHGCEQQADEIGDRFARESGFNRWADAFDVVVLYPQTRATYMPLNPKACWDWWGYSGADYDTRKGVQLRAIAAMAAALGAPLSD